MDKKNKGLVDDNEHGIILNESGTSVSFGWEAAEDNAKDDTSTLQDDNQNSNHTSTEEEKPMDASRLTE